ncbi:MAG TPA: YciI family protein [Alphaproteobacteria bacterium]|jgi:hypothetical protein
MLFVIHNVDKPNSLELRVKTRPVHVEYLNSHKNLFVAGPTVTDDDTIMNGSVLIIDVPDRAAAEAFADGDPYAKAGLFASRTITPWRLTVFNPDAVKK